MVFIGGIKLFDAVADGPLRTEFRQGSSDLVAVDSIAAKIRSSTFRVLDPTARHSLLHHSRYITDLIVLFGLPDVERLVMNQLPRGLKDGQERTADILNVHQRSPGRSVAGNQYLSRCVSKTNEIVYHQIGTEPGGNTIGCCVTQVRWSEFVVGKTRDVALHQNFGFSIRCYWIERRVLGEEV